MIQFYNNAEVLLRKMNCPSSTAVGFRATVGWFQDRVINNGEWTLNIIDPCVVVVENALHAHWAGISDDFGTMSIEIFCIVMLLNQALKMKRLSIAFETD